MSSLAIFLLLCNFVYSIASVTGELLVSPNDPSLDLLLSKSSSTADNIMLSTIIKRIEEQEARLHNLQEIVAKEREDSKQKAYRIEQLEVAVAGHVEALIQKDIRIGQLETDLAALKVQIKENNAVPSDVIHNIGPTNTIQAGSDSFTPFENATDLETQPQSELPKKYGRHNFSKRVGESSTRAAFSVSLRALANEHINEVIMFEDVMLDTAIGYNHGNGIYVVPESGIYVFTWTITTSDHLSSQLIINGQIQGISNADSVSGVWNSSTGLIVISVNTGDHVYIRARASGTAISDSYRKSTFSGWKLM